MLVQARLPIGAIYWRWHVSGSNLKATPPPQARRRHITRGPPQFRSFVWGNADGRGDSLFRLVGLEAEWVCVWFRFIRTCLS